MRHFYWIDYDGVVTRLGQTATTRVASYSGLGYAPLEHFLQGVPSQHRQLHWGLKFRPRIIQLGLWDFRTSTPLQDTRHTTLLAALNADKGEGTLKIVLDDGTERRIKCYVFQGPDFDSEGRRDWFQSYILRFLARNPFFQEAAPQTGSDNFNGATPVGIGVTNGGDICTHPTLVIAAGAENPKVELVSTGEYIHFESYIVPGGENLTINCEAGTIELDDGTNKIGELKKESTLFCIPRGSETLRLTSTSGTGAFSYSFENLYLGI